MRSPTASTPRTTRGRGVCYARRPRLTLCSHDCQRTFRKLSVQAVAMCALCPPLYCPGATRPRQACSQSSYLTLSGCQLLSQGGPGVRLARHRRRQQALRRQRCTARRIGGCDKNFDTTTMHSPTAFHTDAQRGRDVRYAHTIIKAHHVSQTCPHYTAQALRARGKRAVSRLTSRFRVAQILGEAARA